MEGRGHSVADFAGDIEESRLHKPVHRLAVRDAVLVLGVFALEASCFIGIVSKVHFVSLKARFI